MITRDDRLMWALVSAVLLLGGYAQYRKDRPGLPHRPVDSLTNWAQGRVPSDNVCPPGTFRFETDDGLFLECFNGGISQ